MGIRKAEPSDASRIAEILVFSKRTNYRRIFHDDAYSFGFLQVLPEAQRYLDEPELLETILVWDDGFVKGMVHREGTQICELYVDPFFTGGGIGAALLEEACAGIDQPWLWVLEKNDSAIRFYERHGFRDTGIRELEPGTTEYKCKFLRTGK